MSLKVTKAPADTSSGFVLLVCLSGKIAIRRVLLNFFNFKVNISAMMHC